MNETNAKSVVILGTSPVLLIEGLFRARAGQQVVFVEANADIGGAWALTQAMGLSDVEAACHLIVNYRNVYEFMIDDCGIPMEVVTPQPLLFRGRRLTAFNAKRHVFRRCSGLLLRAGLVTVVRLVETMLLGRWRLRRTRDFSLAKAVQSLASHRLYPMLGSASSRAIRYPVGGAPAMLSQLHDELRAHGARFVHAEAEALRFLTEGGVHISLANGDELYARTLVVSESGAVHKVQSAGGTRTYPAETRSHEVLILRVRGVENRQLSYIELPFDPIVERVTDVTAYCQGTVSEGCRILVCESPRSAGPKATSLNPEAILQRLKDLDLLPAEVAIVEHATRQLELRRRNRAFIEHLRDLQCDSIVVVPSHGDLALSIHRNMRRWQNLGKRRPSQVVATDRGTRPMKTELYT